MAKTPDLPSLILALLVSAPVTPDLPALTLALAVPAPVIPNHVFGIPGPSNSMSPLNRVARNLVEARFLVAARKANERIDETALDTVLDALTQARFDMTMPAQSATRAHMVQLRHPCLGDQDPCIYLTLLECDQPTRKHLDVITELLDSKWTQKWTKICPILSTLGAVGYSGYTARGTAHRDRERAIEKTFLAALLGTMKQATVNFKCTSFPVVAIENLGVLTRAQAEFFCHHLFGVQYQCNTNVNTDIRTTAVPEDMLDICA